MSCEDSVSGAADAADDVALDGGSLFILLGSPLPRDCRLGMADEPLFADLGMLMII